MLGHEPANQGLVENRTVDALDPGILQLHAVEGAIGATEIIEDGNPVPPLRHGSRQKTANEARPSRYQH